MRKSILAAYTPPLRNKVRQPAGFPTPFRGGLTRSWIVQFLSAAAGREETGEGSCGPLPLAPYPKGTTPQSAAADSSPYTGEPKNNPSGAARQLPLRGAFESVRPASGGRWERGCRGSDSSPAGNAPRRGKMMCGFCAVAASPQSAAAANGEETGGRCGVRRESKANLEVVRFGEKHKETIGRCGVRRPRSG